MNIDPTIFRTYDIRGRYPGELNEEAASSIAKAYLTLYPHARRLVLAHDTRESSPSLAKALADVFVSFGRKVAHLGIAPDSLFYYSLSAYDYDGGVMVSGSHNPGAFNGMSLSVKRPGEEGPADVVGDELEALQKAARNDEEPEPLSGKGGVEKFDPAPAYLADVPGRVSLARPLNVVVDSGNGAMGYLPQQAFEKLGCRVRTLYGEYDGSFPNHMPDPYQEENLRDLQRAVKEEGADLGFGYDADGDRVAMVDNKGRVVSGDFCLLLLARQAVAKKKGPVVHDVRVSKALLDEMEKEGVQTHFSTSHHNAIIQKVKETGAVFGGEITLHFVFPLDYFLVDDALFASLKLAEAASQFSDLAEHVDTLPSYEASTEIFIDTPDKEKFGIIENLKDRLKKDGYDFVDVDGARIAFPNGWALARAANTTPHIKCRFEGETREALREVQEKALRLFEEAGVPLTSEHRRELGLS